MKQINFFLESNLVNGEIDDATRVVHVDLVGRDVDLRFRVFLEFVNLNFNEECFKNSIF